MSGELRDTRHRIATTRHIGQVTSALQRVSSARLAHDRRALSHAHRYLDRLRRVLQDVLAAVDESRHPLLSPTKPDAPMCLIVFGADRGLCGGYNTRLTDALRDFRTRHADRELRLLVVGRIIARRAQRMGLDVDERYAQPSRAGRKDMLDDLATAIVHRFTKRQYSEVHVLHMAFVSGVHYHAAVEALLPVGRRLSDAAPLAAATFEPRPESVMDLLIAEFVRRTLDRSFLDSLAAENAARQESMSRASENAQDMLRQLTVDYSRLRQEHITDEMLGLVRGAVPLGRES